MKIRSLAAIAMCALTFSTAAAATQVINFGHVTARDSHYSKGVQAFTSTLHELSDGKFTVREHAAGSMGGERDMM